MRLFIYLFNKQKDKKYVKDIQDKIKFHFFNKRQFSAKGNIFWFPFFRLRRGA
jgi:hypothetical protein